MADFKNFKELEEEYANRFEPPTATLITCEEAEKQQDLFPYAADIIRPELNIAKFADFVFASPRNRSLYKVRLREYGAGDKTARVQVTPATFMFENKQTSRTPTVTTEEYFYALIQIWEDRGCPQDGRFVTSGREIFRILNKKAGKKLYGILERELLVMRGALVYFDILHKGQTEIEKEVKLKKGGIKKVTKTINERRRDLKPFGFLDDFWYRTRENLDTNEIFRANILIKLHSQLVDNLNAGITKPVAFKEKLGISSYDARRLYSQLDVHLSPTQRTRKRKATNLLKDLDINGERYKHRRIRRAKLQDFCNNLNGKQVSRGVLSLSIEMGKDDWLLVSTLTPSKQPRRVSKHPKNPPEIAQDLFEEMRRLVGISSKPSAGYSDPIGLVYATTYPDNVIRHALSIFKSDALNNPQVKSPVRVFTAILHREVHRAGLKWIGHCDGEALCKFNPKNLLV